MISKQEVLQKITIVIDSLATMIAFYVAFLIKKYWLPEQYSFTVVNEEFWITLLLIPLLYYIWALHFDIYHARYTQILKVILNSIKIVTVVFISLLIVFFFFKFDSISRIHIFLHINLALILVITSRIIVLYIFRYKIKKGFFNKKIVIIGTGNIAEQFITLVDSHEIWGVDIIGLVDINISTNDDKKFGYKIIGALKNFKDILYNQPIDEVICAVPMKKLPHIQYVLEICEEIGVTTRIISTFFNLVLAKSKIEQFNGLPILTYTTTPTFRFQLLVKRVFDILFSLANLIIFAPFLFLIAISIKMTSPGNVLFRQERCGLNGRKFYMLKFRTMVENAEELKVKLANKNEVDGPIFKIRNDPRITPLGRFLRRTSLDEMPQFINVLKGEMSIVGPRPPVPKEVDNYKPWQRRRLSLRPGLTCIWQVTGRSYIGFEDWMKLDLEYIDNWSVLLDFKLILKTIPAVIKGDGAY